MRLRVKVDDQCVSKYRNVQLGYGSQESRVEGVSRRGGVKVGET